MSDETAVVALSPQAAIRAVQNGRPIGELLFSGQMQLAPVEVQEVVLDEYDKRRAHFMAWLLGHMSEGVHYGVPPGCDQHGVDPKKWQQRATLYKAGAQLMVDLLQLQDTYAVDRDIWELMGQPKGTACFSCTLSRRGTGEVIAYGHGTMEAGEKKMNVNSRVKIAKKRALVDAVLLGIPGLSDLFTQDLDDGQPAQVPPAAQHEPPTRAQLERLISLSRDPRVSEDKQFKIREYVEASEWTKVSASKFIHRTKEAIGEQTGVVYQPWEEMDENARAQALDIPAASEAQGIDREPGQEG